MNSEPGDDPLVNKKYVINCKVRFLDKNVREDIGGGKVNQYARRLVLLVPEISDECMRFFNAWLPDTTQDYFEIACQIGTPVHGPCRVAIKRGPDAHCEKPYLTVMSVGTEQQLVSKCEEGRVIQVTVLPAVDEDEADLAQDASDGNFKVVE